MDSRWILVCLAIGLICFAAPTASQGGASSGAKNSTAGQNSSTSGNSSQTGNFSRSGNSSGSGSNSSSSSSSSTPSSASAGGQQQPGQQQQQQQQTSSQGPVHQYHPDGIDELQEDGAHPWIGRWESIPGRAENFEAFLQAVDVPELKQQGANLKVFHQFWRHGDSYKHRLQAPEEKFDKIIDFKLGEESSAQHSGTEVKYKYREEGQKLVVELNAVQKNKLLRTEYTVNGDEIEKLYVHGNVQAKRWFKRIRRSDLVPGK